ncbi:MAG TPA: sodium:calcium antiporter [Actinomycetota bacterium]|nr:sodium:calcium antiporter [Actinomycetota bacterium]
MDWVFLVASLLIILVAAELFTNGVEWVGEGFGLSEGAVGSVLAAIGTALPETLLPIVAIVSGHEAGDEIGIGAILGAPFMLTTLAMVVIGTAVLFYARGGRRSVDLDIDRRVIQQDLGYFLVMYALAMIAGLLHVRVFDVCLAIVLVVGYGYYVRRHFQGSESEAVAGDGAEDGEAEASDIRPLRLWVALRWVVHRLPEWSVDRSTAAPFVQVTLGLILMVGGAKLFVDAVGNLGKAAGLPPLAFSLLVAPLATELPEKFNSVLWVRRNKDTLAMGNMTGAMVFQSSFPVTVGLLLTPWELAHEALVAAVVALLAGSVLYLTLRFRGRLSARLLLLQGVFYVAYVAYVATKL